MLDGQASHCNELQVLEFAKDKGIVLFDLHLHTHYQLSTTLHFWQETFKSLTEYNHIASSRVLLSL
jgi:hypothetical protein